jgi:hypothetical protein
MLPLAGHPGATLSQILHPFPKVTLLKTRDSGPIIFLYRVKEVLLNVRSATHTQGFTKTHVTKGIHLRNVYGLITWWVGDEAEEISPTFLSGAIE